MTYTIAKAAMSITEKISNETLVTLIQVWTAFYAERICPFFDWESNPDWPVSRQPIRWGNKNW